MFSKYIKSESRDIRTLIKQLPKNSRKKFHQLSQQIPFNPHIDKHLQLNLRTRTARIIMFHFCILELSIVIPIEVSLETSFRLVINYMNFKKVRTSYQNNLPEWKWKLPATFFL